MVGCNDVRQSAWLRPIGDSACSEPPDGRRLGIIPAVRHAGRGGRVNRGNTHLWDGPIRNAQRTGKDGPAGGSPRFIAAKFYAAMQSSMARALTLTRCVFAHLGQPFPYPGVDHRFNGRKILSRTHDRRGEFRWHT